MADLDSLDLDEIDGEFYWSASRSDGLSAITEVAIGAAVRGAEGRTRVDQVASDLIDMIGAAGSDAERTRALGHYQAFVASVMGFADRFPTWVLRQLLHGGRLRMRASLRTWWDPSVQGLRTAVFARKLTGHNLDRHLTAFVREHDLGERDYRSVAPVEAISAISVRVDIALVDEEMSATPAGIEANEVPCIVVDVADPLPPEGVIAGMYDAVVREQLAWHLRLPGSEAVQDKQVAIRTWAIGLLMAEKASFNQAARLLEPVLGYLDLSQEADRQARARLLERVPEARPFLGTR